MGTLFDQPRRRYEFVTCDDVMDVSERAKEARMNIETYVKIRQMLEYSRRTDIMVKDLDVKDEQLAGFGELLQSAIGSIDELNTTLRDD